VVSLRERLDWFESRGRMLEATLAEVP
jgi:hypothetical protein